MTTNGNAHWIASYIWSIANDVLRDLYVRGKYRDVILPMTVLRRLDAVLEDSKQEVLDTKAVLDDAGVVTQDAALRQAAGQAFYNTSKFTLRNLRAVASRQRLEADFRAWLDGFSPNVQDILDNFEFRNQIPRLSKADALGTLIEKLTSPDVKAAEIRELKENGRRSEVAPAIVRRSTSGGRRPMSCAACSQPPSAAWRPWWSTSRTPTCAIPSRSRCRRRAASRRSCGVKCCRTPPTRGTRPTA